MLNAFKSRRINRCWPSFSSDIWRLSWQKRLFLELPYIAMTTAISIYITMTTKSISLWPPGHHHQLHQHAQYHHHQHQYLFPYTQVKTFEISTSLAKHGKLGFLLSELLFDLCTFFIVIFILVTECSSLSPPDNGDIKPGICKTKPLHGQSCSYECDPGFTIVGSTSTTCDNGHWPQGNFQCQGKPWGIT